MHQETLQNGLASLGITLPSHAQQQLITYLQLMIKWNRHINLSGHQTLEKMIPYHLLDSLAVLPFLKGKQIVDIGTGAGLPGIPLAIADPSREYVLVDSRLKKIQFLRTVCRELKLDHVTPIAERAEKLKLPTLADTLIARAVTQAGQLIELTRHLIADDGQWLLMKGQDPIQEIKDIRLPHRTEKLVVPHVDGERCVVIVASKGNAVL
jgi:16S rRNA (guanine527-N7)-methyltransferase